MKLSYLHRGDRSTDCAFHHSDKAIVVEKVMKCSKLDKFCINGRMKEGREGNLFVSLGLTARVTRVQRAQVLQPLCGIIFAWI